jgi:hypothetical protein
MDSKSKEMFARGSLMQALALCGDEWVIAELIKLRVPVVIEQEQPPTPAVITQGPVVSVSKKRQNKIVPLESRCIGICHRTKERCAFRKIDGDFCKTHIKKIDDLLGNVSVVNTEE